MSQKVFMKISSRLHQNAFTFLVFVFSYLELFIVKHLMKSV